MAKNESTVHQDNIKFLMNKVYKFQNDLFPLWTDDMFQTWKNTLT